MKKLSICMGLALALAACGGESGDQMTEKAAGEARGLVEKAVVKTSSPEAAVESLISNLKGNNVMGVMKTIMPPQQLEKARAEYIEERDSTEITNAERAQFDETVQKLTADNAAETMMAEIEPKLAELGAQLPMYMAFGQMAANAAIQENGDLSAEQKTQATNTMNATFKAIQEADVTNPDLLRTALNTVSDTARAMNLTTLDEFRALSFDDAMSKVSIGLGGAKEVLGVYGMSLDDMLNSVETETVSKDGDTATLKVSYSMFGTPQSSEVLMTEIDGQWYMQDLIDQMNEKANEE